MKSFSDVVGLLRRLDMNTWNRLSSRIKTSNRDCRICGPRLKRIILAAAPIAGLLAARGASAATDTWTGIGGSNWNNVGDWTGGNAPPVANDSLVFDGNNNTSNTNDFAA